MSHIIVDMPARGLRTRRLKKKPEDTVELTYFRLNEMTLSDSLIAAAIHLLGGVTITSEEDWRVHSAMADAMSNLKEARLYLGRDIKELAKKKKKPKGKK